MVYKQDPLVTKSSTSRTDVLLGDGVRPSVVSKHLVGQADYTMPFNVAHLKSVIAESYIQTVIYTKLENGGNIFSVLQQNIS